VTVSGKAGTGKTCWRLRPRWNAARIIGRSSWRARWVPLSNKDIGYLPGDIQSKLDPYMQPLFDNLGSSATIRANSDPKHKRIGELLDEKKLVMRLGPTFAAAAWSGSTSSSTRHRP